LDKYLAENCSFALPNDQNPTRFFLQILQIFKFIYIFWVSISVGVLFSGGLCGKDTLGVQFEGF